MSVTKEVDLADFTNEEIEAEYIERFGEADDDKIEDYDNLTIREEYERRFGDDEGDAPRAEILDLIAEAARTSPHAKRAYDLLIEQWPSIDSLSVTQALSSGRMGYVA